MSLWTSLEPISATVAAGETARVRLRLRNTGDVVDEYRFEPVGDVAPWTTVEPQTLRLYPGTTGTVELTFAPPRTPDATAGPHPYAVRITPTEHPEAVTVPEGNLTILPFTEVRAELVPPTVKGRLRGRPRLAVDNLGNTSLTASIVGDDDGDQLAYDVHPSNVQIEPGRAAFVKATLRPRQLIWFGSPERRPYTLGIHRSGREPVPVEGTYLQRGFMPRWLATCLGLALTFALLFVMLWIAYKPQVTSLATEQVEEAAATLTPEPSPTPEPPPAPTTPAAEDPEPPPEQEQEEPEQQEEADSGGGEEPPPPQTKKKKPKLLPAYDILLRNTITTRCVDLPGLELGQIGGQIQQSNCNPYGDNQRWNLEVRYEKLGPAGRPLFQIRNVVDQLCFDLPGLGSQPGGTRITEFTCEGTTNDNQLWWLDKQPSGAYWIRNFASNGLCVDVVGVNPRDIDIPLALANCTNVEDQEWLIVKPSDDG